jgi:predicted Rossmann fold nucleotide-binding protein DprA/Smf involved in DNA uptake
MKKMKDQLKSISKSLVSLSKQVDRLTKQVDKAQTAAKAAPKKKAAPVRKAAAPKRKAAAPKRKAAAPKKPVKRATGAKPTTVLDSVLTVIKRSRKGVSIADLKTKTKLDSRQLSNALYKLTKKGMVTAKSRGLYVKK